MEPFVYQFPVRFSDVDHAGIVYYPRFLHFFHVVFEEFFRDRMGPKSYVDVLDKKRIGFPSVSCECQYRSPLKFGDSVQGEMSVSKLGDKSITFAYKIYRLEGENEDQKILSAEGSNVCAVVDLVEFRAISMPDWLRGTLTPICEENSGAVGP